MEAVLVYIFLIMLHIYINEVALCVTGNLNDKNVELMSNPEFGG